jgi:predicted site-specific integrase-resolvase
MPAISNARDITPDIERLPDSALLTRRQLSELSSFALITLKVWAKNGRGPRITVVEGRPRYRVSDVRAWMGVA